MVWVYFLTTKLSFVNHIDTVIIKLKIKYGILYRNLHYITSYEARKIVFFAFIVSLIDYAIVIWASAPESHLLILERSFSQVKNLLFNNFSNNSFVVSDVKLITIRSRLFLFDFLFRRNKKSNN